MIRVITNRPFGQWDTTHVETFTEPDFRYDITHTTGVLLIRTLLRGQIVRAYGGSWEMQIIPDPPKQEPMDTST